MAPLDPVPVDLLLEDCAWLQRLARSLVKDAHRAEDAVQDTLVAALEGRDTVRSGRAWLASVLRNSIRQEARGRGRREAREAEREGRSGGRAPEPSSLEVAARLELQRAVFEAVTALDEPFRTAVVLRYFDGLAPRAIAKRTGAPVKTVHSRLERGLARLRTKLDGRYGGDRSAWVLALLPWAARPGPGLVPILSAKFAVGVLGLAALGLAIWSARSSLWAPAVEEAQPSAPVPSAPFTPSEPPREEPSGELADPARIARAPAREAAERAPPGSAEAASAPRPDAALAGAERVFFGTVVERESGRYLEGATITAAWLAGDPESRNASRLSPRTSDENGRFSFSIPSGNPGALRVTREGHGLALVELGRDHGGPQEAFTVRLPLAATLEASVVGGAGSRLRLWTTPAEVSQPRDRRLEVDDPAWELPCDGAGRATFRDLPPDAQLRAEVWRAGQLVWRAPESVALEPGETRSIEWRPTPGTRVHGLVRDQDGRPLAGREVWIAAARGSEHDKAGLYFEDGDWERLSLRTVTDGQGAYEVQGLAAGTWFLGPAPRESRGGGPDDDVAPLGARLVLEGGEIERRLDLACQSGLFIEGRVVGPPGRQPRWVRVSCRREGMGGSLTTSAADSDGRFRAGPLAPGRHVLTAWSHQAFGLPRPVSAEAGERGVEIAIDTGPSVSGLVVDERGQPTDAHVHLTFEGGGSLGLGTGSSGTGVFAFSDLRPGNHTLQASSDDGRVAVQKVLVGESGSVTGIVLRLLEGSQLELSLSGAHERLRCSLWWQGILVNDFTLRQEHAAVEVVPPGSVLIELYEGGGNDRQLFLERTLDLAPGDEQRIELDVPD